MDYPAAHQMGESTWRNLPSHRVEAESRRSETQCRHQAANRAWRLSDLPDRLNEKTFRDKIQPHLKEVTIPTVSAAFGISRAYATDNRREVSATNSPQ